MIWVAKAMKMTFVSVYHLNFLPYSNMKRHFPHILWGISHHILGNYWILGRLHLSIMPQKLVEVICPDFQ